MNRVSMAAILLFATALPAAAATKVDGTSVLKDLQPTGSVDKQHKHQAYDLSFQASGRLYTCRTDPHHSVNAVDFVVGRQVQYEIDGKKVKIRTPDNKQVGCKIVRVEETSALQ